MHPTPFQETVQSLVAHLDKIRNEAKGSIAALEVQVTSGVASYTVSIVDKNGSIDITTGKLSR